MTTARTQARNLRINSPTIKLTEIAILTGVTKARVWKILKDEGLPTVAIKTKTISHCAVCGDFAENGKKFCSLEHRKIFYYVDVPCHACGKVKAQLKSYIRARIARKANKNFYCNRVCFYFAHSA